MANNLVILTVTGLHWDNNQAITTSFSAPSRNELVSQLWKLTNQGLAGGSRFAMAANDLKLGAWQDSLSAPGFKRGTARISLSVIPILE